jgi:hypothetical protein
MKRSYLILAVAILATAVVAQSSPPHAKANAAFDSYVAQLESQLEQQHRSADGYIALTGADPQSIEARLLHGELIVEKKAAGKKVPGGMIHHWRGTMFVPGATAADFLGIVQDADHFTTYYKPQVVRSKLVASSGDLRQVSMRLRQHKVITVTLDTMYDVRYGALDPRHGYSTSRSTQVTEIADADTAHEHALVPGDDHGFMWRLNSYWSYAQRGEGLLLQLEAVSLTRDVPLGLDWIVGPFVFSIPRESLEFTLNATRAALLNGRHHGN